MNQYGLVLFYCMCILRWLGLTTFAKHLTKQAKTNCTNLLYLQHTQKVNIEKWINCVLGSMPLSPSTLRTYFKRVATWAESIERRITHSEWMAYCSSEWPSEKCTHPYTHKPTNTLTHPQTHAHTQSQTHIHHKHALTNTHIRTHTPNTLQTKRR